MLQDYWRQSTNAEQVDELYGKRYFSRTIIRRPHTSWNLRLRMLKNVNLILYFIKVCMDEMPLCAVHSAERIDALGEVPGYPLPYEKVILALYHLPRSN
jgi:hypothetical protein